MFKMDQLQKMAKVSSPKAGKSLPGKPSSTRPWRITNNVWQWQMLQCCQHTNAIKAMCFCPKRSAKKQRQKLACNAWRCCRNSTKWRSLMPPKCVGCTQNHVLQIQPFLSGLMMWRIKIWICGGWIVPFLTHTSRIWMWVIFLRLWWISWSMTFSTALTNA